MKSLFSSGGAALLGIIALSGFAGLSRPAPPRPATGSGSSSDSFPHARHAKVACLTCHLDKSGAMLTFTRPDGCRSCHHKDPQHADCLYCHAQKGPPLYIEKNVTIAAAGDPPRVRPVRFPHGQHTKLGCAGCHTTPGTLLPADSVDGCHGCHEKHHAVGPSCATCHRTDSIMAPHEPLTKPHAGCDACHATANIAPLTPTRQFCLACHTTCPGPQSRAGVHDVPPAGHAGAVQEVPAQGQRDEVIFAR